MTTMEDLTKTQIVLLTLLVSFITSIATGIITSSLLAQAPQNVTQTIDRVVERTVEQVAPSTSTNAPATVREVTVVKEGDAIVGAVDSSVNSIVRIKNPAGTFYSLGIVVNKLGLILSDKRDLSTAGTYTIVFSDGSTAPANLGSVSDTGSLVTFKITDDTKLPSLVPAVFSKQDPKLGQTVIAMEGEDKNAVAVGRVLSLDAPSGLASTDISTASEIQGGALLDLSGEVIGLKTSNADLTLPPSAYTVVSALTSFISAHP